MPIAGSRLYERGTITEMELCLVVAAIGLYMGTPFNCTHEPNMPSPMAGQISCGQRQLPTPGISEKTPRKDEVSLSETANGQLK